MFEAVCDCGAVRIRVDASPPEAVWQCPCTICHKLGALWTYHPQEGVSVVADPATTVYLRNRRVLEFHSCTVCGCTTHWRPIDSSRRGGTMGVNARLLDPALLRAAEIQGPDTPAEQIHPANR